MFMSTPPKGTQLNAAGRALFISSLLMAALSPSAVASRNSADGPGYAPAQANPSSSSGAAEQTPEATWPAPQRVKDINPGEASSAPEMFVAFDRVVYFRANDGEHGLELWRTDGTAEGTSLVIDLFPGALNGVPGNLTVAGRRLFFHGFTELTGSKVFTSDGTSDGTRLLVDTFPGAPGGPLGPPLPGEFTTIGRNVLFTATDATLGYELWTTDGTSAGTRLVKDIHPGQQWSAPVGLIPFRGQAFFAADDSFVSNPDGTVTFDRELFVTDGTEAGTVRLIDINPGPRPSIPLFLNRFARQFLFRADDGAHGTELWTSDGTAPGTRMLLDINQRGASQPMHLTVAGTRAFFNADDGVAGAEPWVTDGTAAGTQLLRDINPTGNSNASQFTPFGEGVVFTADDGQNGNELWVSDGTAVGTQLVADINPGATASFPAELVVAGGTAYFVVTVDADEATRTVRSQLWATDGTGEGTKLVWEAPGRFTGYAIRHLTVLGNQLLFSAPTGANAEGLSTDVELYSLNLRR